MVQRRLADPELHAHVRDQRQAHAVRAVDRHLHGVEPHVDHGGDHVVAAQVALLGIPGVLAVDVPHFGVVVDAVGAADAVAAERPRAAGVRPEHPFDSLGARLDDGAVVDEHRRPRLLGRKLPHVLVAHGNRPHRAQAGQHRPLRLLREAHLQRPAGEIGDDPRLLHVVDPARGAQVLPVLVAFQPHLDRGRPLLDAGGGDADRHRVPAVAVDRHRQHGGLPVGGLQESAAEQLGLVVDQAPRAALRLGDRAERRGVADDQPVGRLRDRKVGDEGHGVTRRCGD